MSGLNPQHHSAVVARCDPQPRARDQYLQLDARGAAMWVEVLDGRTLCVAQGPAASDWVLVRLAGAPLATTRQTLMAASFARTLTCVAARGMQAGVEARCAVDGAPLDRVIGTNEARLQGLAWR